MSSTIDDANVLGTDETQETDVLPICDHTQDSDGTSRIRFNLKATVAVGATASENLSKEEREATWWTPSDFQKISTHSKHTLKIMRESGNLDNEPDHCIRGLEHKMHGEADRTRDMKINSIYAVLLEQSRQRKANAMDEETLSKLYEEHVISSVQQAHARGMQDARCVKFNDKQKAGKKRPSRTSFDDFDIQELRDMELKDDMDRFEHRMSDLNTPNGLYEVSTPRRRMRKGKRSQLGQEAKRSLSPESKKKIPEKPRSSSPKVGLRRVLSGGIRILQKGSSRSKVLDKSDEKIASRSMRGTRSSSKGRKDSSNERKQRLKELPLPGRRSSAK